MGIDQALHFNGIMNLIFDLSISTVTPPVT